ncbi:MAG: Fe-S cluster assembly protein SufD [Alphaproteobacteria bacterium]
MNIAETKIMKFSDKTGPETKYTPEKLPNDGPAWLNEMRRRNLMAFYERGLPTSKLERWKYTNLAGKVKDFPAVLSKADVEISGHTKYVTQIMNTLDHPWVKQMFEMPAAGDERHRDMGLWQLAQAYGRDGLVLDVPASEKIEEPLRIHVEGHDGAFFVPRSFFRLNENSAFTIMEKHDGEGTYWNNRLTHVHVGKNATFRHYRIQDYDKRSFYTQNTFVTLEEGGVYEAFTLTKGAKLSRNQIHAEIKGPNAACNLYTLNLLDDDQHSDATWTIEHQAPNCSSDQSVRSLLGGKSHGVFQGKIHVHRPAQKTDGYQLSNALLLSDGAQMSTKPELEIYADDVKCSHGATTGQLNEEALFYMRSRGLSETEARFLVVNAFVAEMTDKLGSREFAAEIQEIAEQWLRNAL